MYDPTDPSNRVRAIPNFDDEASGLVTVNATQEIAVLSSLDPKWKEFKGGIDVYCSGGDTSGGSQNAMVKVYAKVGQVNLELRNLRGHIINPALPSRVARIRDVVADSIWVTVLGNATAIGGLPAGTMPNPLSFAFAGVGYEPIPFVNPDARWVQGLPSSPSIGGTLVAFDGLLYRIKVSVITFPAATATRWLQLWDGTPADPAPVGSKLLAEWAFQSNPTAAVQCLSYPPDNSFDFRDAPLVFNTSLFWVWSTTPFVDTFAGDVQARVDAEVY